MDAEAATPQETSPARRTGLRLAHRGLRSGLAIRAGLALAGAIVALVVGLLLLRHGIVDHTFPPFVQGGGNVVITSYSGPWLTGAVVAGAVAGLLAVSFVTDFWRRRLIGPDLEDSHTHLGQ